MPPHPLQPDELMLDTSLAHQSHSEGPGPKGVLCTLWTPPTLRGVAGRMGRRRHLGHRWDRCIFATAEHTCRRGKQAGDTGRNEAHPNSSGRTTARGTCGMAPQRWAVNK